MADKHAEPELPMPIGTPTSYKAERGAGATHWELVAAQGRGCSESPCTRAAGGSPEDHRGGITVVDSQLRLGVVADLAIMEFVVSTLHQLAACY